MVFFHSRTHENNSLNTLASFVPIRAIDLFMADAAEKIDIFVKLESLRRGTMAERSGRQFLLAKQCVLFARCAAVFFCLTIRYARIVYGN